MEFVDCLRDRAMQKELRALYLRAFPAEERLPFWLLRRRIRKSGGELFGVCEEGACVALVFLVPYADVLSLFYFAVMEEARGRGYGSRILAALQERFADRRIFLNIERLDEPCDNLPERQRRRDFYLQNGFRPLGYTVQEGPVSYELLAWSRDGRGVDRAEYMAMMRAFFGPLFRLLYRREKD